MKKKLIPVISEDKLRSLIKRCSSEGELREELLSYLEKSKAPLEINKIETLVNSYNLEDDINKKNSILKDLLRICKQIDNTDNDKAAQDIILTRYSYIPQDIIAAMYYTELGQTVEDFYILSLAISTNRYIDRKSYIFLCEEYSKDQKSVIDFIEKLSTIDDNNIANKMLFAIEKYKLKENDYKKLLNAKNCIVIHFAIKHIGYKEEFIPEYINILQEQALNENYMIVSTIIKLFEDNNYTISKDIADKLVYTDYTYLRRYACKYASDEKIIEFTLANTKRRISKYKDNPLDDLLKLLQERKLNKKYADTLLSTNNNDILNIAIPYASKEALIKLLLRYANNVKFNNENIRQIIFKFYFKIEDYFDANASLLLNAKNPLIREFATGHAHREQLIERLLIEDNISVIEKITGALGRYLTKDEAIKIICYTKIDALRNYAINYAFKNTNERTFFLTFLTMNF